MLNRKGYLKEGNYNSELIFKSNDIEFRRYTELNNNIKDFEKSIWGINSDPDFDDIPLWNCYTIEDKDYIIGYIIISKRYFENGEIYRQTNEPKLNTHKFMDIEDFVILDSRRIVKIIPKIINKIISDIKSEEFQGIVINPNDYSKSFVKRLKVLKLPIKYYNYPKFQPIGYELVKGY